MKKSLFVMGIQAFVLVFGMTVIGCSDTPQGNEDEWWEKSSGGGGTFSAGGGLDHYQRKKEEVYTEGRLTITGLNDYNGKNITAVYFKFQTITHSGIDKLVAGEKAFNSNIYKNDVLNSKMGSSIEPAIIAGGQVTLNLFEDKGEIQHYYGAYSGNHEKVYFYIYINEPETNKPFDNGYIYAVNFTNGIGSGAFVKTNPHYAPEEVEVTTIGRLTITGLDDYNGKKICALGGSSSLWGYETAYNKYWYTLNGKVERIYPSKTILGTISDGQVTLKVFGRGRTYVDATGLYSESYYNYSGSTLEFFWIQIKDDENEDIIVEKEGPYVQFNNGIGSMVFETETEVETVGRLAISGLNAFEGKSIYISDIYSVYNKDNAQYINYLVAAVKVVSYSNGKFNVGTTDYDTTVNVSGVAYFNIYYLQDNTISSYNGNDKNVIFVLRGMSYWSGEDGYSGQLPGDGRVLVSGNGKVIVDFTNGVGEGTFEFIPY